MNTGSAIQNCAISTGQRFGATWTDNNRRRETPIARACNTNSDSRSALERAIRIRAGTPQPNSPSIKKVIIAETIGDVFSGSRQRTINSKNSHGIDSIRSITVLAARSLYPPTNPGAAPNRNASSNDKPAAAGASVNDKRVPCSILPKRSRPTASVPNQWSVEGPAEIWSRSCWV